ncbi:MAG: iron-containing alcohol dehydrogenase [Planctomyces sp.]|nr:iron-containing alcohol dehydrogenase [Planctomyces sp.]
MRTTWGFESAGRIVFGWEAIRELAPRLQERKLRRAFIVADRTLAGVGVVDAVVNPLRTAGLEAEAYLGGEPEPSIATAEAGIQAARIAAPDVIIGLGGGSNLDLSKLIALCLTHGGRLQDYFGFGNVPGPLMPLVGVPTTAGTGSEVSHAAVLTDPDQHIKISTLSPYLRPMLAIVDPQLTVSCPKKPTADSGMDALTHAVEAYTATSYRDMPIPAGERFPYEGKHPLGDLFAEEAFRLIGQHLIAATREPDNREARTGMALAATLAGLSFSNCGVALVHAMEYPVGGAVHVSHGEGNGLLLPYIMRFTLPKRVREFARIAELLGEDVRGLSEGEAAERAITAVERLRGESGLRSRLRELGVHRDDLRKFAEKAFAITRLMTLTPRPPTVSDILAVYDAAW